MNDLALFGGTPVRTEPFTSWPRFSSSIGDNVINSLKTGQWGIGSPAIAEFEQQFAKFQDAKYCISTNSGTTALWVALKAAGVKAGDEVILPAYTFIATASAVLMANAVPVFADAELETFNMDPEQIEDLITEKTKVIMPVHIAGSPADITQINAIAAKHGLAVVEDAAQAHGAEYNGRKVGAQGIGGIFSFQTSKNMSAGEGGAIVTNDDDYNDACFSYHNCGRVRGGRWYEHQHLGGNFRLSALAAAMLLGQLEIINGEMDIRDRNRARLDDAIGQIPGLIPLAQYPETSRVSNHLYLLRYQAEEFHDIPREQFFKAMQAEGVFTYAGYVPLYKEKLFITNPAEYPWLRDRDYQNLNRPVTEELCNRQAVWLKQNHLLGSDEDIQDIIDAFVKVTDEMRRNPQRFG